jgi:hypothetical protein
MSVKLAPSLNLGSGGGSGRGGSSLSRLGGSRSRSGSSLGASSRDGLSSRGSLLLSVGSITLVLLIRLVRAVNGNLDGNLTALNLLSVHLRNSLLLELLGSQSDEAETTTLAGLTTSLELLDHKSGNRSKSDLGGRGLISLEKLNKLSKC